MARFSTCIGCVRKPDCAKLADIKAAVVGLGVTSLKHRCATRDPEFKPGDPVLVKTVPWRNDPEPENDYREPPKLWFRGVFVSELKNFNQIIVYIKPGTPNETEYDGTGYIDEEEFFPSGAKPGFVKVPRSRVKKAEGDKVDLKLCAACGEPTAITNCCGGMGGDPNCRMNIVIEQVRAA